MVIPLGRAMHTRVLMPAIRNPHTSIPFLPRKEEFMRELETTVPAIDAI